MYECPRYGLGHQNSGESNGHDCAKLLATESGTLPKANMKTREGRDEGYNPLNPCRGECMRLGLGQVLLEV